MLRKDDSRQSWALPFCSKIFTAHPTPSFHRTTRRPPPIPYPMPPASYRRSPTDDDDTSRDPKSLTSSSDFSNPRKDRQDSAEELLTFP